MIDKRRENKRQRRLLSKMDQEVLDEVRIFRVQGEGLAEKGMEDFLSKFPSGWKAAKLGAFQTQMQKELDEMEAALKVELPSLVPSIVYEVIDDDGYGFDWRSFGLYTKKEVALAVLMRVKADVFDRQLARRELSHDFVRELEWAIADEHEIRNIRAIPRIVDQYPENIVVLDQWYGSWVRRRETA